MALDLSDLENPFDSSEPETLDMEEGAVQKEPLPERVDTIPEALLTRLLHEFFKDDKTRIGKGTGAAVQTYMHLFVREAVARAVDMSTTPEWMEVVDLEKLAPQLLMDF